MFPPAIQTFLENVNKASLTARDVGIKNSQVNSAAYLTFLESYRNGTGFAHWTWTKRLRTEAHNAAKACHRRDSAFYY
jgi:hypothetical protein